MSSIFPHRRRQIRHIPPIHEVNEPDPWGPGNTPSHDAASGSSNTRTTTSKIMHSVRRFSSSSPKSAQRRDRGQPDRGMYSTAAESSLPAPSPYSFHDRPDTRPTIEQIAMGLHISRTPHALPQRQPTHPFPSPSRRSGGESPRAGSHSHLLTRPNAHTRRASMSAVVLPPPPARSSLKKSSTAESSLLATSASDASISTMTTLTSNAPSTPRSVQSVPATSFPGKLRMEMLRLLPTRKGSFSSSARSDSPSAMTPASDDDSVTSGLAPRKMVRFSTGPGPHDVPPRPT
ncbi:hypothetical protein C2E23DRAFT_207160 [Lenzites betulinus]|nr:hypothetical protein C2E23DRAFT_207160 [Lenzites betulinus]